MVNKLKRFVIVGLGQFGSSVALRLVEERCEVLAIDRSEERVQMFSDRIPNAVVADATDEKVLRRLGVNDYDTSIISCGETLDASILATTVVRELGVPEIITKANNPTHGRILTRLGATKVIYPETERGKQLADSLVRPDVLQEIALSSEYTLAEVNTPDEFAGKSIIEANVRARYNVWILAIRTLQTLPDGTTREKLLVAPDPEYTLGAEDTLIIIGKTEHIKKFTREKS